jgi:Uncharacterized conserved protein
MSQSKPSETKEISSRIISTLEGPLSNALLTLDKALASQTQTYRLPILLAEYSSAQLQIAYKSLDELSKYAQTRLESARMAMKRGLQDAKEIQKELSDLEKRVRALKDKIRDRWPVEYYAVRDEMDA